MSRQTNEILCDIKQIGIPCMPIYLLALAIMPWLVSVIVQLSITQSISEYLRQNASWCLIPYIGAKAYPVHRVLCNNL